jgi:hypothetical protein
MIKPLYIISNYMQSIKNNVYNVLFIDKYFFLIMHTEFLKNNCLQFVVVVIVG